MRFAVDGWDPGYGTSLEIDGSAETVRDVRTDIEVAAARWAPVSARVLPLPTATVFVDGVRRIDARLWIDEPDHDHPERPATEASPALCASYAAGAVCCCAGEGAHFLAAQIRRGLFTISPEATEVRTWAGSYAVHPAVFRESQGLALSLSAALQHRLTELELLVAVEARDQLGAHGPGTGDELLVVDGPVRGRAHLSRVLGVIKSHQTSYLPPELHRMVANLGPRDRTPVFLLDTVWDRYTWYLRLPGPAGQPWAGVVRVECGSTIGVAEVVALANLSQAVLPRYASEEFKDTRAPQNLYPVAGLERELRRRLGHPALLYRALRQAAHTPR